MGSGPVLHLAVLHLAMLHLAVRSVTHLGPGDGAGDAERDAHGRRRDGGGSHPVSFR